MKNVILTLCRRETIRSHEPNGFPGMGQSLCVFDVVYSSEHALFVAVGVQVELGFMTGLEGINTDLDIFRSNVEIVGDVLNESQHLLEVS